jgi:release factor glutamine methyltransferase
MVHSINEVYKNAVLKLKAVYPVEEARAMTDRLFEHFFNLTSVQRVIAGKMSVDETILPSLDQALTKLLNQVPLQYVLGKAYFMEMVFTVNSSVLIPRPETEELVSLIVEQYSKSKYDSELRILDIGTGSGCIAITLKHLMPACRISAIDFSADAINVASLNALKNSVDVDFIQMDILDQTLWNTLPLFDLIVSNPPYVTNAEKKFMQPNVINYEPHSALFVPDDDPLLFYRTIIALANIKLRKQGSLWFEINERFGNELREMALSQDFREANIIFDFRGKSRFLQCLK